MTSWTPCRFDQVAEVNPTTKLAKAELHPFVPMDAISPSRRLVSAPEMRLLSGGARFEPGDTLMARITPCLENGKIAQYDPSGKSGFGSTEYIVIRARPEVADASFVFYLARSAVLREPAIASMSGATGRQRANAKVVAATEFNCPPLEIQRRIAAILGAYDDLIEVNRRRVVILEEMARGLFEEWFIRYRFSSHDTDQPSNEECGELPVGWCSVTVGEVAAYVNRGITPRYADDVSTLVVGQKCIRDQRLSLSFARRQGKTVTADKLVRAGDILINSTGVGTLGRVAQAEEVPSGLTVDSHVTIVRPAGPEDRDFLGLYLMRMQPVFEALGAGSTGQTELSRTSVQNQELAWPPTELRSRFGTLVRPMRALVAQLLEQNTMLASARDLLLPRLISGQLSVEATEREWEEAA